MVSKSALILLLLLPIMANGTTIRVPTYQPTIQTGIDAASLQDTVLVAPGDYIEDLFSNVAGLVLMSEAGPESTFISNHYNSNDVVTYGNPAGITSKLIGFTIRNATGGNGVFIESGVFAGMTET